jgi:hypothetical protein
MMTYKELQTALKSFKAEGRTSIKLNASKDVLKTEYDRLTAITETTAETPETTETINNEIITDTSEIVIEPVLTIYHSFKEILRQRKPLHSFRPKAQGFKIVKEKRYDQLTHNEWINDTLAFLDDMVYDECDYMAV